MGRYYFGQIILAWINDGRGGTKDRPALIISSDEECESGDELLVIAITKAIENPSPPYHFVVHDSRTLDPTTGLDAPCAAKCNWVREVSQGRILKVLGTLPDALLEQIVHAFDRLYSDETFNDWQ